MTTEPMISSTDAAELAHTYHWYMRDLVADNAAGIAVYGGWLLSMQERMGVTLVDPEDLSIIVLGANERFDELAA